MESFKIVIDVNYLGAVRVTKALIPFIQRGGTICGLLCRCGWRCVVFSRSFGFCVPEFVTIRIQCHEFEKKDFDHALWSEVGLC